MDERKTRVAGVTNDGHGGWIPLGGPDVPTTPANDPMGVDLAYVRHTCENAWRLDKSAIPEMVFMLGGLANEIERLRTRVEVGVPSPEQIEDEMIDAGRDAAEAFAAETAQTIYGTRTLARSVLVAACSVRAETEETT
jgi:hypothetical protein